MRIDWRKAALRILIAMAFSGSAVRLRTQNYVQNSEPKLLSYDELVQLGSDKKLSSVLAEKLRLVTTTPFVNNEAYLAGAKPRPFEVEGLGPSLRVAFWNIERGLEIDNILLFITDKERT